MVSYVLYRKIPNLLYLNFIHMQLLEYFMWRDQGCSGGNQVANRIALALISLEPLCSLLSDSSRLTIPRLSPLPPRLLPWNRMLFTVDAMRFYCAVTAVILFRYVTLPGTDEFWCSVPSVPTLPDSHLQWKWCQTDGLAAMAYYGTCFVPIASSGQWMTGGLYLGTWMYSVYGHAATGGWPSIWCSSSIC